MNGELRIDADLVLGAKAVEAPTEDELVVEGYFATYDLDRQGERFMPQSFAQAAKAFLESGSRAVLYQHKPELGQLGVVEALEEREKGLWGRARLPKPALSSPLLDHWLKIKAGHMRGISIRTRMLARKLRDGTVGLLPRDIIEFSMTPTPVNAGGVVGLATKALEGEEIPPEEPADDSAAIREYLNDRFAKATADLDAVEAKLQSHRPVVSDSQ